MPYIHPTAVIIGNVTLGRDTSVWPTAVLRGDLDAIMIGDETNVQDGVIMHVDAGRPVHVGHRVTIGHRAVIHGCIIEDDCLIGIGAIVLNGAVIGTGSVIGAAALVPEGMIVPPGSLVLGVPGKVVRAVDAELRKKIEHGAATYVERGRAAAAASD